MGKYLDILKAYRKKKEEESMVKKKKRRNPGDPDRVKVEKQNLRRSRKRMKEVSLGVYIRKDCPKTLRNHSCEYIGVLALGQAENRYRIKGTHVAKASIGRGGVIRSGFLTALTLLANYEFFEEWDISKPDHQRMIDYAKSRMRTKLVAQELEVALLAKKKQGSLFIESPVPKSPTAIVLDRDAKLLPPLPPLPPSPEIAVAVPPPTKVTVNGVEISGDSDTVQKIVRDLVFDG